MAMPAHVFLFEYTGLNASKVLNHGQEGIYILVAGCPTYSITKAHCKTYSFWIKKSLTCGRKITR
jgi:hypothetical protein